MTYVPFAPGDILTAGSLRLIPQFYASTSIGDGGAGSTSAWTTVATLIVSGGDFSQNLIVYPNIALFANNYTTGKSLRLMLSGAGLGGGSVVDTVTVNTTDGDSVHFPGPVIIPSNQGWIPGNDVAVMVQRQQGGTQQRHTGAFTIFGEGA